MVFHPEVMPEAQQRVLRDLGRIVGDAGFYLAGGTAIGIHLGHRESVDLGWFTGNEIADPLGVARTLRDAGISFDVRGAEKGTLHGETETVKLSFPEYRYPLLRPAVTWPEYGCQLASLEDLACMKLAAVTSRGAKKDFIDLYGLGETHFTLSQMLELYREKYQAKELLHVLTSLTYFDDAEPEENPRMLRPLGWNQVKRAMQTWVAGYGRSQAPRA